MTFLSLLRDNENLSGDMLARIIGSGGGSLGNIYDAALPPGIGAGSFTVGVVGKMNGAAGADPNHFSVQANGTTLVLTVRPGWIWIRRDSGSVSLDPRCVYVEMTAAQTVTLAANNQGSTRVDQICLRYDLATPPDATGSNIPSLFIVQGGAASALAAAPADAGTGALYVVLATVTILNTATNVAQSAVTDKRYVHPSQCAVRMWRSAAWSGVGGSQVIPFDNKSWDFAGLAATGAAAAVAAPNSGYYRAAARASFQAAGRGFAGVYVAGAEVARGNDLNATGNEGSVVPGPIIVVQQGQLIQVESFAPNTTAMESGAAIAYIDVEFVHW